MYRSSQARDVVRLLSRKALVMEQEDLEVTGLGGLPDIQQKMLDGRMGKPKGVALVQADRAGRSIAAFEDGYLGEHLIRSDAGKKRHVDFHLAGEVGILTLCRPEALNALNNDLIRGLGEVIAELKTRRGIQGRRVRGLILRGAGRAFVAGADVTEFAGSSARRIEEIALSVLRLFSEIENLKIPVIAVLDGFTLGGGNELAMSAHYRIATENAVIGQPEIKLGIIPGYGGLQRLPRLVGPLQGRRDERQRRADRRPERPCGWGWPMSLRPPQRRCCAAFRAARGLHRAARKNCRARTGMHDRPSGRRAR